MPHAPTPALTARAAADPRLAAALAIGDPGTAWRAAASCREADAELFFARTYGQEHIRVALRICRHCPVAAACLAEALLLGDYSDDGVWGHHTTPTAGHARGDHERRQAMTLTVMDWFCGAGGSSQGIHAVPGVEVALAANHWDLALKTHAENFPGVRHEQGDIRELDVQNWPVADGFWASPECTRFSNAQGVPQRWRITDVGLPLGEEYEPEDDAAAERSRALMWDVPKYLDGVQRRGHLVKFGVVENVIEAFKSPQFPPWLRSFDILNYDTKIIAFNSMHAQGTESESCCQSRNRLYVGYIHRSIGRTPDWDKWLRPLAHCTSCAEDVMAVQRFKKPGAVMGSYGAQYVYRCPKHSCRGQVVEPEVLPALTAIDLTIPAPRIGDKPLKEFFADKAKTQSLGFHPLAPNTLGRIRAGAERFWAPLLVPTGGTWRSDASPLDRPMPTRTTRENDGVAVLPELLVPVEGRDGKVAQPATLPGRTQTARNETGIALPPYLLPLRGGGDKARAVSAYEPLRTVSAEGNHHGLVVPLVMRNNNPRPDDHPGRMSTPVTEPIRTLTTAGHQSLLVPPMLLPYYGNSSADSATDPMSTVTTRDRHGLITPGDVLAQAGFDLGDVRFRMLEPDEIGRGMAFRSGYTVLGSKRDRVRQYGNAVTPPVAELIVSALAEAVHGEDLDRRYGLAA